MTQQIVKQPNGLYAVWSSVSDDFIALDATPDELIKFWSDEERGRIEREVREEIAHLGNRPSITRTTWEAASCCRKEVHGMEEGFIENPFDQVMVDEPRRDQPVRGSMSDILNISEGCPLCGAKAEQAKLRCASCGGMVDKSYPGLVPPTAHLRLHCFHCEASFDPRLYGEEERKLLKALRAELIARNEGQNLSCWPLGSFGFKDADLGTEGCTGIRAIIGTEGEELIIEVGGHKTIPGRDCVREFGKAAEQRWDYVAHATIAGCGFTASWSDDEWVVETHSQIRQTVVLKDGEVDISATVERIICEARLRLRPYEEEMAILDETLNDLYKEIETGYKKATQRKMPAATKGKRTVAARGAKRGRKA